MNKWEHITDAYFKDKLDRGLIDYSPDEWVFEGEEIKENEL